MLVAVKCTTEIEVICMPTIKEIAKASNVSVATVSNVINGKGRVSEETKRTVRKVIEELNYTPNYVAKI